MREPFNPEQKYIRLHSIQTPMFIVYAWFRAAEISIGRLNSGGRGNGYAFCSSLFDCTGFRSRLKGTRIQAVVEIDRLQKEIDRLQKDTLHDLHNDYE